MLHSTSAATSAATPATPLGVVDADGIAELLRVSRRTLDRIVRKDKHFPKLFRIGARQYVRLADLQSWVEMKAKAA
jgi:predicted DNA-binding transcriptional regulator AlpA